MSELQSAPFLLFCDFRVNWGHAIIHCGDFFLTVRSDEELHETLAIGGQTYQWSFTSLWSYLEHPDWSGDKSSSAPFGVVWQERWGTGQSGELALIYGCYLLSVVNNQPGDSTWLLLAFHIWIKSYSKLTDRAVCLVQLGVCVNRPLGVAQKPMSIGGQPL